MGRVGGKGIREWPHMPLVPQHFAPTDKTRPTADRLLVAELELVALRAVDNHLTKIREPKRPTLAR